MREGARSRVFAWLLRVALWTAFAVPLGLLGYSRPVGGYGRWGEPGLYILAVALALGALFLPEWILARLFGPRAAEKPARPQLGTRLATAELLLRKGLAPANAPASSRLSAQLRLVKTLCDGLGARTARIPPEVAGRFELVLRLMEEGDPISVGVPSGGLGPGLPCTFGVAEPSEARLFAQALAAGVVADFMQAGWLAAPRALWGADSGRDADVEVLAVCSGPARPFPRNEQVLPVPKRPPACAVVHS